MCAYIIEDKCNKGVRCSPRGALPRKRGAAARSERVLSVYDASAGSDIPLTADAAYWVREDWSANYRLELHSEVFGVFFSR
jgi:hypothetical protein